MSMHMFPRIVVAASIASVLLASMVLNACVTPPPAVSSAFLNGASRVAIVNIAIAEPLMLITRNNSPSSLSDCAFWPQAKLRFCAPTLR